VTRARQAACLAGLAAACAAAPAAAASGGPAAADAPVRPLAREAATIAHVVAPVVARSAPAARSRAVWHVPTTTGWSRQSQVLLVLRGERDASGRRWLQVELPIRPNARSAWIPADYARLARTAWWIDVSTARRLVTVWRDGRVARRFRAVVGAPGTPTPHGLYALWEKNPQPDPGGFLGPWALPITALSNVLERYGGGPGRVAIHGRDGLSFADPLGSAASHGCIRVDNDDVLWLARRVPRGTPVRISS
jgi:hypothetical protein